LLFFLLHSVSAFGQGVRVGPDGEFSEQTLSLPYAFYNESFGFAAGYVYGVVGRPQKQATLLATVMAGSKGSACILPNRFSLYTNKFSQVAEKCEKNWCVKITIARQNDIISV